MNLWINGEEGVENLCKNYTYQQRRIHKSTNCGFVDTVVISFHKLLTGFFNVYLALIYFSTNYVLVSSSSSKTL